MRGVTTIGVPTSQMARERKSPKGQVLRNSAGSQSQMPRRPMEVM